MDIIIGSNILNKLPKVLSSMNTNKILLITDENVAKIYLKKILNVLYEFQIEIYVLKSGEKSKSVDTVLEIYDKLIEFNFDRNTTILSLGGGVVGDIAGFVASTYMRGIKYIQVPTTLLAQVDSSIGGKVGIDYKDLKNIIGSFYFPVKNFVDVDFLQTLDTREIISGLGEVFKYGLIEDYDFFTYVDENLNNIYEKDYQILMFIVEKSIDIKNKIVQLDKKDENIRKKLNFGHTIGHSIETLYNFEKFNHGEAVILGILYESYISKEMELIDNEYFSDIFKALTELVNPIFFDDSEIDTLLNIMYHDKKNIDNRITFILPTGKGEVDIFYNVEEEIIRKALRGIWI